MLQIPIQGIHRCDGFCPKEVESKDESGSNTIILAPCNRMGTIDAMTVGIAEYDSSMPIHQPDEVVITDREISILFNYPLSKQACFTFESPTSAGFTRRQLIELIVDGYKRIYHDEEKTTRDRPIIPEADRRGSINRNQTDGIYGIWGHDIDDLWLEDIKYNPIAHTVNLGIGS